MRSGRLARRPGVCAIYSGVAHLNALTGVANAWFGPRPDASPKRRRCHSQPAASSAPLVAATTPTPILHKLGRFSQINP